MLSFLFDISKSYNVTHDFRNIGALPINTIGSHDLHAKTSNSLPTCGKRAYASDKTLRSTKFVRWELAMKTCATEDFDACVEIKGTGIRDRVRRQDTPAVKKHDIYLDIAVFFSYRHSLIIGEVCLDLLKMSTMRTTSIWHINCQTHLAAPCDIYF